MAKRNRARDYENRRALREARRREGICIDCLEDATNGVRCRACAAKAAARARAYYHAHADECRKAANQRYHAAHPQARYIGPRKRKDVPRAA